VTGELYSEPVITFQVVHMGCHVMEAFQVVHMGCHVMEAFQVVHMGCHVMEELGSMCDGRDC
jgi:hypothetical protein